MKILFVVYILVNGQWVHGADLDGWSPIPFPSWEACERAVAVALANPHPVDMRFECQEEVGADMKKRH